MGKRIILPAYRYVLSFSFLSLIILLGRGATAQANMITVCAAGCDYSTIQAAVTAAAPNDVITIMAGVYTENVTIHQNLVLHGAGINDTIIDGNNAGRVFIIDNNSQVTMTNMRITHGDGGIHVLSSGVVLTLTNTLINDNISTNSGGGLLIPGGTVILNNSTIDNNHAPHGGGIFVTSSVTNAQLRADNSTISNNVAGNPGGGNGGGIFSFRIVTLTNSTVSGNRATGDGGGIYNTGSGAVVTLTNSTVSNNMANGNGGGIFNVVGIANLQNTIIAGHSRGRDCQNQSTFNSLGFNLGSDGSCPFTAPNDISNTDPLLDPLADHGGDTLTQALQPGSPAIDRIPAGSNGCIAGVSTDQRGVIRANGPGSSGVGCDIGAYEYTLTTPTPTNTPTAIPPTPTLTPLPTSTLTPTPRPTSTPTAVILPSSTPANTATSTPLSEPTQAPLVTATSTPSAISTPNPAPTSTSTRTISETLSAPTSTPQILFLPETGAVSQSRLNISGFILFLLGLGLLFCRR